MARLTATLVDAVAPIAVVYGGGHAAGYEVPGADLGRWAAETDLLIVIAGWLIINHVILVGVLGLTLGKAFLGLRVVDARTRTRSPGLMRALTRSVLLMPGILVTIAYFAFGRRLAFHDLIAGTAVVYA